MEIRDDLISRAAALNALDNERKILIEQERFGAEHVVVHHARRLIEELPAVGAVPVEWLKKVRNRDDMTITLDDVETIDWLICLWQKEQEAHDD